MSLAIETYKGIIWDFDGVILDSMAIRDSGFSAVLKDKYSEDQIEKLLRYHNQNGGLSRYHKFAYFLKEIVNETENLEQRVQEFAADFKAIMLERLTDESLLIKETVNYISQQYQHQVFYIASGSDQTELRKICQVLNIDQYFKNIFGSPVTKIINVETILSNSTITPKAYCLIGDSINDFEAATANSIDFFGFNNSSLKELGKEYIHTFDNTKITDSVIS